MKNRDVTLSEMVAGLVDAYGSALKCVVLYGSAARDERDPERSDYNLLVIIGRVSAGDLRRASELARRWLEAGNPPPLMFSEQEWKTSSDIFPMECADVLEQHRVLHGVFDAAAVTVDLEHFRLQLEQEAMGVLLQLRQGAMVAGDAADGQRELALGMQSRIMVVLRGLIRLHGQRPPARSAEVVSAAAGLAAFDPAPFLRILDATRQGRESKPDNATPWLDSLLAACERIVAHINSFHPPERTYSAAPNGAATGEFRK